MKIERNANGEGFVLTNGKGEALAVSFMEFWDICKAGTRMNTRDEVEDYLKNNPEIGDHDLERVRAFPVLVNKIAEQVIQDRIDHEYTDQIYEAAENCIEDHITEIEDKIKWFAVSDSYCVSVWYAPDKYDGDQFQMHLELIGGDGRMGPGCEVVSSDSYATADVSVEALCETLNEVYQDARRDGAGENEVFVGASEMAEWIRKAFEMEILLVGQYYEVKAFFERFRPTNKREQAEFNYMLGTGNVTDHSLAIIGDARLLDYLWDKHSDNDGSSVRKTIMENPRATYLVEKALKDPDWEVRKAVVWRGEMGFSDCIQMAMREKHPLVQKVLKEKLGDYYPKELEQTGEQALARTLDGKVVAVPVGLERAIQEAEALKKGAVHHVNAVNQKDGMAR